MLMKLHEKPYSPSPAISWKAKKKRKVSVIFLLSFWLKKRPYLESLKSSNKNFSVINKYHIYMNFLSQKNHISHF